MTTEQKQAIAELKPCPPTPCCNYQTKAGNNYPVFWNEFNGVVQCHNCGQVYSPNTRATPQPEYNCPPTQVGHCEDCDPAFLTCWNNRAKCVKQPDARYQPPTQDAMAIAEKWAKILLARFSEGLTHQFGIGLDLQKVIMAEHIQAAIQEASAKLVRENLYTVNELEGIYKGLMTHPTSPTNGFCISAHSKEKLGAINGLTKRLRTAIDQAKETKI